MYTEEELKTANYLELDPAEIKGFETDPDLRNFVLRLVSLKDQNIAPETEMGKLLPTRQSIIDDRKAREEAEEEAKRAEDEAAGHPFRECFNLPW